jgi:hypothetical protein
MSLLNVLLKQIYLQWIQYSFFTRHSSFYLKTGSIDANVLRNGRCLALQMASLALLFAVRFGFAFQGRGVLFLFLFNGVFGKSLTQ